MYYETTCIITNDCIFMNYHAFVYILATLVQFKVGDLDRLCMHTFLCIPLIFMQHIIAIHILIPPKLDLVLLVNNQTI